MMTGAHAIAQVLGESLSRDPRVMLVGEATDGLWGALGSLRAQHPDRVLLVPIAERGALGLALGAALGGRPVVIEVAGASRLRAALEVLAEAGAVAEAGEFAVPLCIRVVWGTDAPGHDIPIGGWLLSVPGVRVVCPSTAAQLAAWLGQGTRGAGPLVLLESREALSRSGKAEGEARLSVLHRQGVHVTLAATGDTIEAALDAAESLQAQGIEAEVLELVSLAPLDVAALGTSVKRTGRLVVVHPADPAIAQHVQKVALEQAFWSLEAPLGEADALGSRAVADAVLDIIRA